jgi:hypothetical protein
MPRLTLTITKRADRAFQFAEESGEEVELSKYFYEPENMKMDITPVIIVFCGLCAPVMYAWQEKC